MQKKLAKPVIVLVAAGLLGLYQHFQKPSADSHPTTTPAKVSPASQNQPASGNAQAVAQIRAAQSNPDERFWTVVQGTVVKVLKDDQEGNPHQRFLFRIAPDITLLVAHNIDLAQRVPLAEGDALTIRGEYAWNDKGGVLHWTHHDPHGSRKGGWIELNGQRYE